jgi:hypothetical protein
MRAGKRVRREGKELDVEVESPPPFDRLSSGQSILDSERSGGVELAEAELEEEQHSFFFFPFLLISTSLSPGFVSHLHPKGSASISIELLRFLFALRANGS